MEEYNFGCIENYIWNLNNLNLLKNVIKQVIFSVIYAYNKKKFTHGNLHTGNILLQQKKNSKIIYENKTLVLDIFEVVIMDFEKSKLNQNNKVDLLKNILKFIASVSSTCLKNDLIFYIDTSKLKSIFNEKYDYYDELEKIIDNMIIEHW